MIAEHTGDGVAVSVEIALECLMGKVGSHRTAAIAVIGGGVLFHTDRRPVVRRYIVPALRPILVIAQIIELDVCHQVDVGVFHGHAVPDELGKACELLRRADAENIDTLSRFAFTGNNILVLLVVPGGICSAVPDVLLGCLCGNGGHVCCKLERECFTHPKP